MLVIQIDHAAILKVFDINGPGTAVAVQHLTQFLLETVQFHILSGAFMPLKVHVTSVRYFLTSGNSSV